MLEWVECAAAPILFAVDGEDLRPHLPSGFAPSGPGGERLAQVNLNTFQCDGVVVDNATVLAPVGLAMTIGMVEVNETLRAESEFQWYVFELFTDNDTLLNLFLQAGLPARKAVILLEMETTIHVSISVDGSPWYEGTATHSMADGANRTAHDRWFWKAQDDPVSWSDFQHDYTILGQVDALALRANNGFLREIKPGAGGALLGATQEISIRGTMTFGQA